MLISLPSFSVQNYLLYWGAAERFIIMMHNCLQMSPSSCSGLVPWSGAHGATSLAYTELPSEPTHMHNTIIVSALMSYDFLLTMNWYQPTAVKKLPRKIFTIIFPQLSVENCVIFHYTALNTNAILLLTIQWYIKTMKSSNCTLITHTTQIYFLKQITSHR